MKGRYLYDFYLFLASTLLGSNNFRFMLGLDDLRFISPWFAVKDFDRGSNLVMLNVIFIFNGPNIIDVKWNADCKLHF